MAPHAKPHRGWMRSAAKVAVVTLEVLAAFAWNWRGMGNGGVVIWERGWHDMLVDPARYRLHPGVFPFVRRAARFVPRADIVVVACGDPAAMHARKPETTVAEVERQLQEWKRVAPHAGRKVVFTDTVGSDIDTTTREIMAVVADPALRLRSVPLTPRRVALAASSPRAVAGVYRPFRRRARIGLTVGSRLARSGIGRRVQLDAERLWPILDRVGEPTDDVTVMGSSTQGRIVVALWSDTIVHTVAKIGSTDDTALRNEAAWLERLADQSVVAVPRLRFVDEIDGRLVVATQAVDVPDRQPDDERILDLATRIAAAGIVHGDFAPWNVVGPRSQPVVLDWESARGAAVPLFDLAHYVVQRGALLRHEPPGRASTRLTAPGSLGWRHLERLGVDPTTAARYVTRYLDEAPPARETRVIRYRVRLREIVTP